MVQEKFNSILKDPPKKMTYRIQFFKFISIKLQLLFKLLKLNCRKNVANFSLEPIIYYQSLLIYYFLIFPMLTAFTFIIISIF